MENIKTEVKSEQGATKRSIEEVDDNHENINDRNKKIKAESVDINTDAVTSDVLKCEVKNEAKYEAKSEIKNEVKSEVESEVKYEVKNEVKNEVNTEVESEVKYLVKNEGTDKNHETNAEKEASDDQKKVEEKINYSKKKKCVLLLSYCGSGYNGMQRNPGVKTIEEDLTNALFKARAISEDASRNYGKMSFQRCARTDKGVSAARQVVSLKMVPYKELLPVINKHLEEQIRVFALKQVTRGFDCKSRCSSRTYEYLLPTFAFSPTFAHTTRGFRITSEIIDELNVALKKYVGTKNFHNFTSGKDCKEESAKRYIIRFQVAGEPFLEKNMEFLVLQVQGQSFMQHQIRKMIGLVIAIMKKYTGLDAIDRAFQHPKMDIPRAPGLGLVLDQVHFRSYNERFGRDGFHEPLEWSECEDQIKEFKQKYIYSQIIETEATTNSMMRWLSTLSTHTYSNEGMMELQKNKGTNANEETSIESKENVKHQGEEISSNDNAIVSSEVSTEMDCNT